MQTQTSAILEPVASAAKTAREEVPFGMNEVRLSGRQWLAALSIVAVCLLATPRAWKKLERFETGADYRIPHPLSKDYWLYERRLEQATDPAKVPVLGDSVVWGEYVLPTGTLSHFLNQETGRGEGFINCGVNGLFPLALEGLVEHYGASMRNRKIIVQCNLLWMSSPKADLSIEKEESFNHSRLAPQFRPRIPCYRADAAERLSVVIERNVSFSAWVGHLQNAYFAQRSAPAWTLQDDGDAPAQYPNAWRNPLAQITFAVPSEPIDDPQRGPRSARHRPWSEGGAGPTHFDWIELDTSLQWHAFQRTIRRLRDRGNNVLVILGPFNEHMVLEDQLPAYRALRDRIATWLSQNQVPHIDPDLLPSSLYADASHPLTEGYAMIARQIRQHQTFGRWLAREDASGRRPR